MKIDYVIKASTVTALLFLGACEVQTDRTEELTTNAASTFIPVTDQNYVQAETDWNFAGLQAKAEINTWIHKGVVTKDSQTIIRSNADVVYSIALVDVSKGVTFTVPKRENGALQLIHYIDENHLTHGVVYAGESKTVSSKDLTGGDYVYILARTKVSDSLEETKAAQRSMVIDANSAKPYVAKGFEESEVEAFRTTLITNVTSGKVKAEAAKAYGETLDVLVYSDYMHGAALGWGALPPQHAQYTPSVNGQGSDEKCQTITIPKPNLDYENGGFFSLTTYNAKSWIEGDQFHIGQERMKNNGDGTMTIDFNCNTPYSVTVSKNWNGTFRLYKPVNVQETIATIKKLGSISITKK